MEQVSGDSPNGYLRLTVKRSPSPCPGPMQQHEADLGTHWAHPECLYMYAHADGRQISSSRPSETRARAACEDQREKPVTNARGGSRTASPCRLRQMVAQLSRCA